MKPLPFLFFLIFSFSKLWTNGIEDMSAEEMRSKINQYIMEIPAITPEVYSVQNTSITCEDRQTPIRIYSPGDKETYPIALFIHGGAWVAGSIDTHDNLARYLCSNAKVVVISVGYLNPPEGKFPLPLEQCYDALLWICKQAPLYHADPSKIAVVGDSAGGNMAAALCLMAKDRSSPKISLQILINPAPDLTCGGTLQACGDQLDFLRKQARYYLSDHKDAYHPYVSPLVAKNLESLPPALILLAENDAHRENGHKYADRLRLAAVPVELYCQMGAPHLAGYGARAAELAIESLDKAVSFLKTHFAPETQAK